MWFEGRLSAPLATLIINVILINGIVSTYLANEFVQALSRFELAISVRRAYVCNSKEKIVLSNISIFQRISALPVKRIHA